MRCRIGIIVLVCMCVAASQAQAFWPFSRGAPQRASPTEKEWQDDFENWKAAPIGFISSDVEAAAVDSAQTFSVLDSTSATVFTDSLVMAANEDSLQALAEQKAQEQKLEQDEIVAEATAKAAQIAAQKGFTPAFSSTFSSTNDNMSLDSRMNSTFTDISGISLTSSVSYGKSFALTQNTDSENKGITNSFTLPLDQYGLRFALSTTNTKSDRLTRNVSGTRTRSTGDNKTANLNSSLSHEWSDGVRSNAFVQRQFSQNASDIVATIGSVSGSRAREATGNAYGTGINVDRLSWLKVRARFGRAINNNIDRSPSLAGGEAESVSEGDTASVNIDIANLTPWLSGLALSFRTSNGSESFTDVTRSSSGGATSATDFTLETRRSFSRTVSLSGKFSLWSKLTTNFDIDVGRDSTSFEKRQNQFRDQKTLSYRLDTRFNYSSKGAINVNFESSTTDDDHDELGNPRSAQTRRDEERRVTANMNYDFTRSLKVRVSTEARLNQGFFEHVGPQGKGDRDQFRTRAGITLDGKINDRITAKAEFYVRTFDQAFIDPRRSRSSRNETEYVVRQNLTYNPTRKISISQVYGLSSKVLDEIFNPLRNTLNRSNFLNTRMSYRATERLGVDLNFDYALQDNGSFLDDPLTASLERFFSPVVQTKRDEIGVGIRYDLIADGKLRFTSNQQTTREHRTSFSGNDASSQQVFERGNVAVGVSSKMEIGELKLETNVERNQSSNVSVNRNVFWNVRSTLSYQF